MKKAYRVAEAAELLEVSRKTVERLIRRDQLAAFKVGRTWRIREEAVEAYRETPKPQNPRSSGRY